MARSWSVLFALAAAFNLAVGVYLMLAPGAFMSIKAATQTELLPVRMLGWLIGVFGVGYALVAIAPREHLDIVRVGLIGKAGIVAMVAIACGSGSVEMVLGLPALADLVWVVAFALFLTRYSRGQTR